jgi:SAM-dependent methyltransferase
MLMRERLLSSARRLFKSVLRSPIRDRGAERLYREKEYLQAYSEHTDLRVESDPHAAIGGLWEELGQLQFDFLVGMGLQPRSKMLDIGCGTLRGGRHFIRYLDVGCYTGIDISPKAIEYGKQLIQQEGLSSKQARLLVSQNHDLKFREFAGETFDVLLAQSVFTHLLPEHIKECLQYVGNMMHHDSRFFFTFNQTSKFRQTGLKDFCYPFSFFQALAQQYGYDLKDVSSEYRHPRSQRMALLSQKV